MNELKRDSSVDIKKETFLIPPISNEFLYMVPISASLTFQLFEQISILAVISNNCLNIKIKNYCTIQLYPVSSHIHIPQIHSTPEMRVGMCFNLLHSRSSSANIHNSQSQPPQLGAWCSTLSTPVVQRVDYGIFRVGKVDIHSLKVPL